MKRVLLAKRRGFTIVELGVVMALMVLVLGVAFSKFRTERLEQRRQMAQVDRQQAVRRFLMWFRHDMQSMSTIRRFNVLNSFDTEEDSRVIQVDFDRYEDETSTRLVSYRFDFNRRRLSRYLDEEQTFEINNIANFQLKPFDYTRKRILRLDLLPMTYYLDARVVISGDTTFGKGDVFQELVTTVYPRLNASVHKAGFNQFRINNRFSGN
jgi:type II secretory pathway pseudopilin PulG